MLIDSTWIVEHYEITGDDETFLFEGYVLEFDENGGVLASFQNDIHDGSWEEFTTHDGQILALNFGEGELFSRFTEEWFVLEIDEGIIVLKVWLNEQEYKILTLKQN